jgi:hypothetical protein
MNKLILLRKASIVHLIKCEKSIDFSEAIMSFDQLSFLKREIQQMDEDNLSGVNKKINDWAGTNPIVTDREIDDFMNPNTQK